MSRPCARAASAFSLTLLRVIRFAGVAVPVLQLDQIVLILCVSLFTAIAAVSDYRFRRIPNKLTVPFFAAGLVYQLVFHQAAGLLDALAGFGFGFGVVFILWMVGGGGGGDVKMMGALSAWLGLRLTAAVLIVGTFFVLIAAVLVLLYSLVSRGLLKTKQQYFATSIKQKNGVVKQTNTDPRNRRLVAFAIPIACATWVVVFWSVPQWPFKARPAEQQHAVME